MKRNAIRNSIMVFVALYMAASCAKDRIYSVRLWPGPIQAFKSNESYHMFLQFDQIFAPKEKRSLWDHPIAKRKGSVLWHVVLNANGTDGSAYRLTCPDALMGICYNITLNPNLGRIFNVDGHWYLWRRSSGDQGPVLWRLKEREFVLVNPEMSKGGFLGEVMGIGSDSAALGVIKRHNSMAELRSVYEDIAVSSRLIDGRIAIDVIQGDELKVTVRRVASDDDAGVVVTMGNMPIDVSGDYIDSLPDGLIK